MDQSATTDELASITNASSWLGAATKYILELQRAVPEWPKMPPKGSPKAAFRLWESECSRLYHRALALQDAHDELMCMLTTLVGDIADDDDPFEGLGNTLLPTATGR